jgi:hypothetical protein
MKQDTKACAGAMLRQHRCPPHNVSIQAPLRAADAKRSVKNILQWNCYLPADASEPWSEWAGITPPECAVTDFTKRAVGRSVSLTHPRDG